MEEVKTKVCPKCGEEKLLIEFNSHQSKCKECQLIYQLLWKKNNQELTIQSRKRYYLKNKERLFIKDKIRMDNDKNYKNSRLKWSNNPINRRILSKKQQQTGRNILRDSYVKKILRESFEMPILDITPEMIELKRVQIQLFRKTKQFLKEEAA